LYWLQPKIDFTTPAKEVYLTYSTYNIHLGGRAAAAVFVEARLKGRPEGSPITDYVVEDHADHALMPFRTQREASDWAKQRGQLRDDPHRS
jgi:hypothetical protein